MTSDDLRALVAEAVEEATTDLRDELAEERARREQLEERVEEVEAENEALRETVEEQNAQIDALEKKAGSNYDRLLEIQCRELEKGAHLRDENVYVPDLSIAGGRIERITKEDGETYVRLPGERDALERGGAVAHSTADLLPIQRLSRYDDEMLANVTNRKPDELAAKAWRERDEAGRYDLWTNGGNGWRVYLKSSDLAQWIRAREDGVSRNYSQELARRTMDAMHELSKSRLVKKRKNRRSDGLEYKENVLVLREDVDLPGEISPTETDDGPATDEVAG